MKKTTVVNLRSEDYDIYIGRGSIWGNPYSHLKNSLAKYKVSSRKETIEKYRLYIENNEYLLSQLNTLKGKRLGCFCKPKDCHGDVLVSLIESIFHKYQ